MKKEWFYHYSDETVFNKYTNYFYEIKCVTNQDYSQGEITVRVGPYFDEEGDNFWNEQTQNYEIFKLYEWQNKDYSKAPWDYKLFNWQGLKQYLKGANDVNWYVVNDKYKGEPFESEDYESSDIINLFIMYEKNDTPLEKQKFIEKSFEDDKGLFLEIVGDLIEKLEDNSYEYDKAFKFPKAGSLWRKY